MVHGLVKHNVWRTREREERRGGERRGWIGRERNGLFHSIVIHPHGRVIITSDWSKFMPF